MDLNPAHGTALTMDGTNQGLTAKGFPETKALDFLCDPFWVFQNL